MGKSIFIAVLILPLLTYQMVAFGQSDTIISRGKTIEIAPFFTSPDCAHGHDCCSIPCYCCPNFNKKVPIHDLGLDYLEETYDLKESNEKLFTLTNQLDSLYIARIDSIQKKIWTENNGVTYKQFEDTLNQRTVVETLKKEELITIYYTVSTLGSESATFLIQNDSLIYVEYVLSDPDIHSMGPPSTTYKIYFKNEKQIYCSTTFYMGGTGFYNKYSFENKDFIKEFYYYKEFLKIVK